jgi:hypothetical protein
MRIVNVQRISFLTVALALAAAPVAFGADPPSRSRVPARRR